VTNPLATVEDPQLQ